MKGNSYQRQKMPNLVQVDRDDIMQQDLPVGEEVPFVSVYFGDYTDSYSALRTNASVVGGKLNPELSRDGSHIVWVENARTKWKTHQKLINYRFVILICSNIANVCNFVSKNRKQCDELLSNF